MKQRRHSMDKTVQELAIDAIKEAHILEYAREYYDETHMLEIAESLCGVPYFMVKEVYDRSVR